MYASHCLFSLHMIILFLITTDYIKKRYIDKKYDTTKDNNTRAVLKYVGYILYVILWTFALNLLCKLGYTGISWFIVLLPFILAVLILTFLVFFK